IEGLPLRQSRVARRQKGDGSWSRSREYVSDESRTASPPIGRARRRARVSSLTMPRSTHWNLAPAPVEVVLRVLGPSIQCPPTPSCVGVWGGSRVGLRGGVQEPPL